MHGEHFFEDALGESAWENSCIASGAVVPVVFWVKGLALLKGPMQSSGVNTGKTRCHKLIHAITGWGAGDWNTRIDLWMTHKYPCDWAHSEQEAQRRPLLCHHLFQARHSEPSATTPAVCATWRLSPRKLSHSWPHTRPSACRHSNPLTCGHLRTQHSESGHTLVCPTYIFTSPTYTHIYISHTHVFMSLTHRNTHTIYISLTHIFISRTHTFLCLSHTETHTHLYLAHTHIYITHTFFYVSHTPHTHTHLCFPCTRMLCAQTPLDTHAAEECKICQSYSPWTQNTWYFGVEFVSPKMKRS